LYGICWLEEVVMIHQDMAFHRYLRSLVGSWEALAAPRSNAGVTRGEGDMAARFPEPYLNNAVVLTPSAVARAAATYRHVGGVLVLAERRRRRLRPQRCSTVGRVGCRHVVRALP
jgi:hypothetical protein